MEQKPITAIVSDMHLGGGKNDPGDDHVYQGGEFIEFLQRALPESADGRIELFINGDFLEFAQVMPDAYKSDSPRYWCSEEESLEKLEAIIAGHADILSALKEFADKKNIVTLAAGNHDVDLWWPAVQKRLRKEIGEVEFALGDDWFYRYGGRLVIGHGHMFDPANRFKNWKMPILDATDGSQRLEMCPGTLLMVKFINSLEKDFPFADNLKPLTALARLLYVEQRSEFYAALWLLGKFAKSHFSELLSVDGDGQGVEFEYGEVFLLKLELDDAFAEAVTQLYADMRQLSVSISEARAALNTEEAVCEFLAEIVLKIEPARWTPVLNLGGAITLGVGSQSAKQRDLTLSAIRSGMMNDKRALRRAAEQQLDVPSREVVVCGHTHQPDEWRGPNGAWAGGYFNPGSWTRYVDASQAPRLTMADLVREEDFPYELNCIRVAQTSDGILRGDKVLFKRAEAKWS
jgi:UDP-2,3-diacylglucosamine pyrophosphatase LpxH